MIEVACVSLYEIVQTSRHAIRGVDYVTHILRVGKTFDHGRMAASLKPNLGTDNKLKASLGYLKKKKKNKLVMVA